MTSAELVRPTVSGEVIEAGRRVLSELVVDANREYELAGNAARITLAHAIKAGEALAEARAYVPHDEWVDWLDQNFDGSRVTASMYIRLAAYQEHLSVDMGVREAHESLTGLPRVVTGRLGFPPTYDEHTLAEVRALRRDGLTYQAIADILGLKQTSVYRWLNPPDPAKVREAERRRDRARRAKARDERQQSIERAAKSKAGTGLGESYSQLRKLAQALERAQGEAKSQEHKAQLSKAQSRLYAIEDALIFCLGVD